MDNATPVNADRGQDIYLKASDGKAYTPPNAYHGASLRGR